MGEVLPMPSDRRRRLKELETVIAAGWERVVEVGRALREIRDEGYYLEVGATTFDQYCKSRWSIADRTALQYMDAAAVHQATRAIGAGVPILNERVGRELAPLLREGGPDRVTEAWSKVSDRFRDQRPPTAREVHQVLVEEGYRPRPFGVSSGKVNRRILLGRFGDKLTAAEKRLDWFIVHELGEKPLAKTDKQLAADYAEKCEAMGRRLREIATP